ncbi:M48 family metalloprotease [Leadbettera azotonutricia]|uniref:Peptidase, M48 family n=1 Tax=Leadbettera azotonutricia (strain ATCC BAA-888 / DSM 13862 / ZAS-9) TaxID=545695 RepID=F5Y8T1_LEAAZ|nr:M48 family metalloprotease [Leadbettera azotonutricia]AEF81012.1 peptidase, M48 family [Leadbettera azotonutricia ZAS-9]
MKKLILGLFCALWVVFAVSAEGQGQKASGSGQASLLSGDVSDALSGMDKALATAGDEMTSIDDYYLGRAVAVNILGSYKIYTANPDLTSYLNKICLAITVNSPNPVLFNGYHAEILDSAEINAFATPGGHIFLSRGLIACADSEDALAAVIAHEIAHIQLRHAAAIIQAQRTVQDLTDAGRRAAAIASRDSSPAERAVLFGEDVSSLTTTLFKSGYAQSQEYEADTTALALLRNAGYDPSALPAVLQVMEKNQKSHAGGFNNTHPSPASRIASLGRISGNTRGRDTLSSRQSRFKK